MNAPLPPRRRDALDAAPAMRVLERVATEGRQALAPADVAALLESLGMKPPSGAPAGETVALRIALQETREYGLILSAGLGGTDGAMMEHALRRGLGRTDALVGLTDAADFLDRFRGTYAYQAAASVAQRAGRPVPDEMLADCFASLLALADALAANPEAAWSLRILELEPVQVRMNGTLDVAAARCTLA
ncbi:MAG TPA: hypothetical protein VF196_00585, partial [Casimicrobiaceae bacterium]